MPSRNSSSAPRFQASLVRPRPVQRSQIHTWPSPTSMTSSASAVRPSNQRRWEGNLPQTAGAGTSHVGYGRCKNHGGSTRAGTMKAGKLAAKAELTQVERGRRGYEAFNAVFSGDEDLAASRFPLRDHVRAQLPVPRRHIRRIVRPRRRRSWRREPRAGWTITASGSGELLHQGEVVSLKPRTRALPTPRSPPTSSAEYPAGPLCRPGGWAGSTL
jgi:hypothetical protein